MSDKYEGLKEVEPFEAVRRWEGLISAVKASDYAALLELYRSLLQERDQLREDAQELPPVEPPQWEDYFRALKLSYPENLTAIYVAKEVYSMFMSAPKGESE